MQTEQATSSLKRLHNGSFQSANKLMRPRDPFSRALKESIYVERWVADECSAVNFDNVMTKFIINKRTGA